MGSLTWGQAKEALDAVLENAPGEYAVMVEPFERSTSAECRAVVVFPTMPKGGPLKDVISVLEGYAGEIDLTVRRERLNLGEGTSPEMLRVSVQ